MESVHERSSRPWKNTPGMVLTWRRRNGGPNVKRASGTVGRNTDRGCLVAGR